MIISHKASAQPALAGTRERSLSPETDHAQEWYRRAQDSSTRGATRLRTSSSISAHSIHRLRRQAGPTTALRWLLLFQPSIVRLINRFDTRLRGLGSRQILDLLAVQAVTRRHLDGLKAVENVKLGQRDARRCRRCGPPGARAPASNQPHRRGRPVLVPNSRPRSPIRRPTSSLSSVGTAAADAVV